MQLVLEIGLENAAFEVEGGFGDQVSGREVARILRRLAGRLDVLPLVEGDGDGLRDINGNTVGLWEVVEEGK